MIIHFGPVPEVQDDDMGIERGGQATIVLEKRYAPLTFGDVGLSKQGADIFFSVHSWKTQAGCAQDSGDSIDDRIPGGVKHQLEALDR